MEASKVPFIHTSNSVVFICDLLTSCTFFFLILTDSEYLCSGLKQFFCSVSHLSCLYSSLFSEINFAAYSDIFPTRCNVTQFVYFWKTALLVSGGIATHHQEHMQLYLQQLALFKPLLLPAAFVEELKL